MRLPLTDAATEIAIQRMGEDLVTVKVCDATHVVGIGAI
jgi:hypothetical protein